jgi:hypothetical protein
VVPTSNGRLRNFHIPVKCIIWTLAGVIQGFAMLWLAAQGLCTAFVASISGRAIALEAWSLVAASRRPSLQWLSEKRATQAFGSFSRPICSPWLWGPGLIYQIFVHRRVSNFENDDKCPVLVLIGMCFLLAWALHADNHLRPIYDTL